MQQKVITLVGGSGFLGRYITKQLASAGYAIRIISRNPAAAIHLKTAGDPGQVVLTYGNILKPESFINQLTGSHAVINLVGVLFEKGRQNFSTLHAQGAEQLAKLSKQANVEKFIHISALGVDKAVTSKYARTKVMGEKAVSAAFPGATILRPGVVFGPEDDFYNRFAVMARYMPFMPLIGGGKTRFQPIYAGDVAKSVKSVIERDDSAGKMYELGGRDILTLKEVLQYVMYVTGYERPFLSVPFGLAAVIGLFLEWTPSPMLTSDQVKLLHYDNIVGEDALTMSGLNIEPTPVNSVVPYYLSRFGKHGRGTICTPVHPAVSL